MESNILQAALSYRNTGLEVIPVHKTDKYPVGFPDWQTRDFTEAELKDLILNKDYGIGIRNLEGLDFDNHSEGEASNAFGQWSDMVESIIPGLIEKLVIEATKNEGYHVFWKCEQIEGNQKLASRLIDGKQMTFIETRGEGGQFVVSPTPGYESIQGSTIPTITPDERSVLLDSARALNEVPQEIHEQPLSSTGDRPGDKFNQDGSGEALEKKG